MSQAVTDIDYRQTKRIRALKWLVNALILAGIVYAFTVELWVGLLALLLAWFFSDVVAIAALAPFFGVHRVREALWGELVLEPTPSESAPSPPEDLCGKVAEVVKDLDPEGEVAVEGRRYPARSDDEPIRAGSAVKVGEIRLGRLVVAPKTEADSSA